MARNTELVRQWEILRSIDGARNGIMVPKLAAERGVHQRTIRRDIDAPCRAGFPLYDEKINGTAMWKLRAKPFRGLEETGLGVIELCALYFSRTVMGTVAGGPFRDDLERAFAKVERALPPASRRFLDRLPTIFKAKIAGRKKQDARQLRDILTRAVDAALSHRRVATRYASASSRRTKDYVVEPLRVSYADGGIYLIAFVPEYSQVRTFAIERIRTLALLDEHFEPGPLPAEAFPHSLGVFSGTPEPIEIEFDARIADHVGGREWHRSQQLEPRPDGSLLVRLCVCNDHALRSWILSFGPLARVVAPTSLSREILEQLQQARERYIPRLTFEMARMRTGRSDEQQELPLPRREYKAS